jgi:predicted nuclease of predicted toxin-antitoxin system
MANLYSNECFNERVVERLRALGHDVLTTREAGNANQEISDADVLAYAVKSERAVITYNGKDFRRLHRDGGQHYGIIICRVDRDVAALASRINAAIAANNPLDNSLVEIR